MIGYGMRFVVITMLIAGYVRAEQPDTAAMTKLIGPLESKYPYRFRLEGVEFRKAEDVGEYTKHLYFQVKGKSAADGYLELNRLDYLESRSDWEYHLAVKALPFFPDEARKRLEAERPPPGDYRVFRRACSQGEAFVFNGEATAILRDGKWTRVGASKSRRKAMISGRLRQSELSHSHRDVACAVHFGGHSAWMPSRRNSLRFCRSALSSCMIREFKDDAIIY